MKKLLMPIVLLVAVFTLFSCGGIKQFAYYQNIDTLDLSSSKGLFDAKIMPKDGLVITVNTTDPRAAVPFNLNTVIIIITVLMPRSQHTLLTTTVTLISLS